MVEHVRRALTLDTRIGLAPRLVLVTLSDFADADGIAFPSVGTIGTRTELGRRAVQAALAKLVGLGLVARLSGGRGPGDVTHYRVFPTAARAHVDAPIRAHDGAPIRPKRAHDGARKGARTCATRAHVRAPEAPYEAPISTTSPSPLQANEPDRSVREVEAAEFCERAEAEREAIARRLRDAGVSPGKSDELSRLSHVTPDAVQSVLRDAAKARRSPGWIVKQLADAESAGRHAKLIRDERDREQAKRDADAARAETERRIEAAYEAYHRLSPADRDTLYRRACVGLPDDWLARSTPELPARAVRERLADLYRSHRNGHTVAAAGSAR